jgi:hypothetical protein
MFLPLPGLSGWERDICVKPCKPDLLKLNGYFHGFARFSAAARSTRT